PGMDDDALLKRAIDEAHATYRRKMAGNPPEAVHHVERLILLSTLDNHWLEHLAALDHLRQGIHLRGYAQKNPKQEYKRESFELFSQLLDKVNYDVISGLSKFEVQPEDAERLQTQAAERNNVRPLRMEYKHVEVDALQDDVMTREDEMQLVDQTIMRNGPKVGRNDSCPCGSGKKYKQCHGKLD